MSDPYTTTQWQDRVVEKPRTFTVTNNPDGTITLTPSPGVVVQEGTPVNANLMNRLEQGVFDAYYQSGAMSLVDGTCEHVNDVDGYLTEIHEKVGGVLLRRTDLAYTTAELSSLRVRIYASDGITVISDWTDALTYPSGVLKVTRTVTI